REEQGVMNVTLERPAPPMPLAEFRDRIGSNPSVATAIDKLTAAGFDDDAIVRLLLGGKGEDSRRSGETVNDRIVLLLLRRGGTIESPAGDCAEQSPAGDCAELLTAELGAMFSTVRQALVNLDREGRITR